MPPGIIDSNPGRSRSTSPVSQFLNEICNAQTPTGVPASPFVVCADVFAAVKNNTPAANRDRTPVLQEFLFIVLSPFLFIMFSYTVAALLMASRFAECLRIGLSRIMKNS
jgi:uncharacterized membrane protein